MFKTCKFCKGNVKYDQPHIAIDDKNENFAHLPCFEERERRDFEGRCTVCNTDLEPKEEEVCDKCRKLGPESVTWIGFPGPETE